MHYWKQNDLEACRESKCQSVYKMLWMFVTCSKHALIIPSCMLMHHTTYKSGIFLVNFQIKTYFIMKGLVWCVRGMGCHWEDLGSGLHSVEKLPGNVGPVAFSCPKLPHRGVVW